MLLYGMEKSSLHMLMAVLCNEHAHIQNNSINNNGCCSGPCYNFDKPKMLFPGIVLCKVSVKSVPGYVRT